MMTKIVTHKSWKKMVTHKSWRCQEKVFSFPNQAEVARKQEPVLWDKYQEIIFNQF